MPSKKSNRMFYCEKLFPFLYYNSSVFVTVYVSKYLSLTK